MLEFISSLRQRYQAIALQLPSQNPQKISFQACTEQLLLAEALLRKSSWLAAENPPPLNIVVIGPTQAGKSSITNALLQQNQAGVSPLAAYTVHPQGFCCNVSSQQQAGLQHYFGRYQQLTPAQLSPTRYDCYALTTMQTSSNLLPNCILWDTPDFDSIAAPDYKESVIRTLALADIVILVLSKEKYADQSVWELMHTLEALKQPTLICFNKLIPSSEALLLESLKTQWQQNRTDKFPEVVTFAYHPEHELIWSPTQNQILFTLAKQAKKHQHARYQQEYLYQHWDAWLEPVLAEHQATNIWHQLIEQQIQHALSNYQRDYLNHPQYYATFQQALIAVLHLLEIPTIAHVFTQTRRILTWPLRKLIALGKSESAALTDDAELAVLQQTADYFMLQLAAQLLEQSQLHSQHASWWQENYRLLRQQQEQILLNFNQSSQQYQLEFQLEIEQAAQKLYSELEQHPFILNSLRATRATTDVATIAAVIYTGGIGVHDLIITPAMLSLISLLTEGALGSYLQKIEHQLKQQQLQQVKSRLFVNVLQTALRALPAQINSEVRFNISPQQLHRIQQQRLQKRHGLQIL